MKNLATLVVAAGFSLFGQQATTYKVTITDLGVLPGGIYSSAYAINNTGKIAGMAYDSTGALVTVQWVNGVISPIPGANPAAASVPEDMNDAGEIAGTLRISNREYTGIYWNANNQAVTLPPLPPNGSVVNHRAHAINSSGQIAGMAQEGGPNLYGHASIWLRSSYQQDLGFMGGGIYSEAYGINDLGEVVGIASIANTNQHGFLWRNGVYTDLSTLPGGAASSAAYAINQAGEIVGLNNSVASLWKGGRVTALPMPPGISAYCPAIDNNNAGDIIATCTKVYPIETGILWRNGQPIDLGTLPGGTVSRARRINAAGEIVGEANISDGGPFHAVKWKVEAITGNTLPAVTLAATTATSIRAGGSVSFRGTFTDPDSGDGPWNYTWTWGNGTTPGTASAPGNITATRTFSASGTYRVTLKVTDARGGAGTSSAITVRVR